MSDLVTIVIPTYNYGHFLGDCIDSVLSQSHQETQVVVVDDGSTDDTRRRLLPYGARVQCVFQQNQGLSAARNTGLANAEGEFIQLLDADDLLHPRAIEHRLDVLNNNSGCSWVVGQNYYFSDTPFSILPGPFRPRWGIHSMGLEARLFQSNIAPPHSFLARKELFDKVGGFDTSMRACEDYDYWMRALAQGYTPVYSPRGLVYYRRHESSMSSNLEQQWKYDVIMHHRIVDLFAKGEDKGQKFDTVLNRLFSALGIMNTLNANVSREEATVVDLLELYEANLSKAGLKYSGEADLRLVCVLSQLWKGESEFVSNSGGSASTALAQFSSTVAPRLDSRSLWSEFFSDYLTNVDANLKTKLDYFRWLRKSKAWTKTFS